LTKAADASQRLFFEEDFGNLSRIREAAMTKSRVGIAAVAAGVAMYFWTSLAHLALPLATIGVSEISSNETAVLDALHNSMGNASGLYLFPSSGWRPGDTSSQRADAMKNYDAKLVTNPSGLLIYHPPGMRALTPGQLVTEFLVELLEAALAVWLLVQTRIRSVAGRTGFVAVAGLLAALPTNISYWNWYGFPGSYTASYMTTQIIGFGVAGLVAGFVLRGSEPG
jgi:hypothetical protein